MPRLAGALAVGLAVGTACGPLHAQTQQDIFRQVFGAKARPATRQLDLPVVLDGREAGAVRAEIGPGPDDAALDLAMLADLLDAHLQPDAVRALRDLGAGSAPRDLGAGSGLTPAGEVAVDGMAVEVDQATLALRVTTAPTLRRTVVLDLAPQPGLTDPGELLAPAFVSAYANLRFSQAWHDLAGESRGNGRQPLGGSVDAAFNLYGWVAEAEAFYREDGEAVWQRGDMRLLRDFPDHRLRVAAGDIGYPLAGFQAGRPLGGLAVASNFLLRPYETFTPSGQQAFVLDQPSLVEVEVNGRPTRVFRLAPGSYDLRNLPGTAGTNDVTVRITDPSGREEVIAFPFFFDNRLLAPGVHEFAYAAGLPSRVDGERYRYDEELATLTALHRAGLSEQLTVGANLQADRRQWLVGGEVLFATPLGTFGLEPSASGVEGADTGYAAALRFRDYRSGGEIWQRRSVTAQAIWRSEDFAALGTTRPNNPVSWDLAARIGQPVTTSTSLTLGTRYQVGRGATGDAASAELGMRTRVARGLYFDVSAEHLRNADGTRETVGYASLRFTFADGRHAAGASYDTASKERRLEWRYQDAQPVDALSVSADVARDPSGDSLTGAAAYVHPRFSASLRHDRVERPSSSITGGAAGGGRSGMDSRSSASFATALAFADGHLAVSRPITDSFAIVVPHRRIADREVGVDRFGDSYVARTDLLGPAVVPSLSSHRLRPMTIEVPDAPAGYDLGEDRPTLLPSYRSGTVVPVGTDGVASVAGVLQGPDGAPLGLQAGVLEGPDGAQTTFFTNRTGRFRIDGVSPGAWRLVLTTMEAAPVAVSVPADADGTIDLGVVVPR
ncbi:fimbrial biogenesis outer membrane usher protein [Arenibaculum sp.]|jgi:outer membrane usher protein|uniref:fimbrial biogenesis outer membrane usher protein n=1 Tax=Arenibaculum sp. TaxID=2865862 RepID=UPI002E0D4CAA|nr:fimbrial biogenesis outer membrane usher protein [Arenibaculum sp.]